MQVTDEMVDRFLCWKLPKDFGPDAGVSFKPPTHPNSWPVGTNLLTADQARSMLEHVLATETEFAVYVGGEWQAGAAGPREQALAEARNYAAQYAQDGYDARIEEVTRRTVEIVAYREGVVHE